MPLQLERRGQFVDPFVEQFHHIIVGAVEHDFAGPHRAPGFNLHSWVRHDDPGSAHPSKTFPHAFENPRPIVAPLILIIVANKIGCGFPVLLFDRVKKILRVTPYLVFRPPNPEKIQPEAKREGQT